MGIASHWPFESWGRFLPEYTIAVSLLDRLPGHQRDHNLAVDNSPERPHAVPNAFMLTAAWTGPLEGTTSRDTGWSVDQRIQPSVGASAGRWTVPRRAGAQNDCGHANTLSASRPNTFGDITMNILAKTAAVVLAAAALCGTGVANAAAATSDQVSTSSLCTDLKNNWDSKLNQQEAEMAALNLKMQQEKESDPAQYEADYMTYNGLYAQYKLDEKRQRTSLRSALRTRKRGLSETSAELSGSRTPGVGAGPRPTCSP